MIVHDYKVNIFLSFTSGSIEKGEEGIVDERVNKITAASSGGIVKEVDVKVTH